MTKFSVLALVLALLNSNNNVDAAVNKKLKNLSPVFKSAQQKLPQTPRYRRKLEDAEAEEDEEEELNFLSGYNVLYQNCFVKSRTVSFKLCPKDDNHRECDQEDCEDGGEYIMDMETFLDAFTELTMDAQEYRCEMARENCEQQQGDDDANQNNAEDCYIEQGYDSYEDYTDDCENNQNNNEAENEQQEFNLQEYLACREFDDDYYVGPSCEDSVNLYLALFTDDECMYKADTTPQDLGYDMPYSVSSGTSIISEECASCEEHGAEEDQNGGNDAEDANDVIEQCEQMYQQVDYKCETSYMTSDYHEADSSSCRAIAKLKKSEDDFQARGGVRRNYTSMFLWTVGILAVAVAAVFVVKKHKAKKADTLEAGETKKEGLMA